MPTATADLPQGPSLEDAAARMEAFLDLEGDLPETPPPAARKSPTVVDEGVAEDAGDRVTAEAEAPEETTAQAEGEEAEAPVEEESPQPAEEERPQYVTVTHNGKSEQLPLDEVVAGYQRHQDYTAKTTELAGERKALAAESEAVKQERQTYATMLVALRDQLQSLQPQEPDWDAVFRSDPVGYARQRDEWRDKTDKLAAANFELQRLQTLQQQDQAKLLAETVQKGRARMLEMRPAWKDQTVWEADRKALIEYAQKPEVGYSAEEISQAYDPRAIILLDKARRYDELMAKKPKPVATNGPRVAAAGVPPRGNGALNQAQQRLARTGSIADAAKVFEHFV